MHIYNIAGTITHHIVPIYQKHVTRPNRLVRSFSKIQIKIEHTYIFVKIFYGGFYFQYYAVVEVFTEACL